MYQNARKSLLSKQTSMRFWQGLSRKSAAVYFVTQFKSSAEKPLLRLKFRQTSFDLKRPKEALSEFCPTALSFSSLASCFIKIIIDFSSLSASPGKMDFGMGLDANLPTIVYAATSTPLSCPTSRAFSLDDSGYIR